MLIYQEKEDFDFEFCRNKYQDILSRSFKRVYIDLLIKGDFIDQTTSQALLFEIEFKDDYVKRLIIDSIPTNLDSKLVWYLNELNERRIEALTKELMRYLTEDISDKGSSYVSKYDLTGILPLSLENQKNLIHKILKTVKEYF